MTDNFVNLISPAQPNKQAWIVFTNQTDLPWVRVFKKGFRHCFILINDGEHWISVDPMANYMDVVVHHVPCAFDLSDWLEKRGHSVVPAQIDNTLNKAAPWMLFTCVEACKRILGIHKRFIFTPWQLHQYLEQQNNNEIIIKRSVFLKMRAWLENFFHKGVVISWEV